MLAPTKVAMLVLGASVSNPVTPAAASSTRNGAAASSQPHRPGEEGGRYIVRRSPSAAEAAS